MKGPTKTGMNQIQPGKEPVPELPIEEIAAASEREAAEGEGIE
jgi:hypothetical protein